MRGAPRGSHRSVDRGTCRPGIELRNQSSPACRRRLALGRLHPARRFGEPHGDAAQSETPGMHGNSTRENREIPAVPMIPVGRSGKATSRTPDVHATGKSDGRVVPAKDPNKDDRLSPAEGLEGRRPTKENTEQLPSRRTQRRDFASRVGCSVCVQPHRIQLVLVAASIRGRSRMREFRSYGSVRGAPGNRRSYRDSNKKRGRRPRDPKIA